MCLGLGGLVVLHLVKFPVLIVRRYVGVGGNQLIFCISVIKCRSLPIACTVYNNEVISVSSEIRFAPNDRESDLY